MWRLPSVFLFPACHPKETSEAAVSWCFFAGLRSVNTVNTQQKSLTEPLNLWTSEPLHFSILPSLSPDAALSDMSDISDMECPVRSSLSYVKWLPAYCNDAFVWLHSLHQTGSLLRKKKSSHTSQIWNTDSISAVVQFALLSGFFRKHGHRAIIYIYFIHHYSIIVPVLPCISWYCNIFPCISMYFHVMFCCAQRAKRTTTGSVGRTPAQK